jgi:hypothetical protein
MGLSARTSTNAAHFLSGLHRKCRCPPTQRLQNDIKRLFRTAE